mmetsp:Transcript_40231/g.40871  ORF Transcript_40231/g.40871 Transcript_40231/m.40871 type:complete len:80 (-) Transcript_40231:361-600(-)
MSSRKKKIHKNPALRSYNAFVFSSFLPFGPVFNVEVAPNVTSIDFHSINSLGSPIAFFSFNTFIDREKRLPIQMRRCFG